jgi:hypothetical protein
MLSLIYPRESIKISTGVKFNLQIQAKGTLYWGKLISFHWGKIILKEIKIQKINYPKN